MPTPNAVPGAEPPLRAWVIAAVLFGLALVVWLPAAWNAQFVNFDDPLFFGAGSPFADGLAAVFDPSRPIANAWLPVAHASLWLDWWLGGGTPLLPHLTSLLLHALAGCVLVRLVEALGARRWLALAVGGAFVAHPALAESVVWVSGRKDVLCGLFVFTALLLVARDVRAPRGWRPLAIAVCAALAMYAKATAVVLPLLALLVGVVVARGAVSAGVAPSRWRRHLGPLVSLLVVVPIAWHHQTIAAAEGTLVAGSTSERLMQVPGAFWHYLATTFWPRGLNVLYPEVDTLARFRDQLALGLAALALALACGVLAWRAKPWRLAAVGGFAFALALLPFNTAFPASSIAAADRYLYLAVPGAALAAFAGLQRVAAPAAPWLAAAFVLAAAWLGNGRAFAFRDSTTLWQASLAVAPENAVAHLNLVQELLSRGPAEVATVRQHLDAAVAAARHPIHELRARELLVRLALVDGDYPTAAGHARAAIAAAERQLARETAPKRRAEAEVWLLRACLQAFEPLRRDGDLAGAEAACARVRAGAPGHREGVGCGRLRSPGGARGGPPQPLADDDARGAAADAALAAALQRTPQHAGLLCTQAAWDQARGRVLPALRNYRLAQDADPGCLDAWLGAARLLRSRANYVDAERYARRGLAQRADPALRQELALALVGQGRLDDAILHLEACLRLRPDDQTLAKILANKLVGRAYARLSDSGGDRAEVLRTVLRALELNPDEAKAYLVLGRLAREQREFATAVAHFERAHRLLPDLDDARQLLAESLADLGLERLLAKDDAGAGDAFRRCLDVAPPEFATGGVAMQLQAIWRRCEAEGQERYRAADFAGAEAAFRRCLFLEPTQDWAAWLLALALHEQPHADAGEIERLCRRAIAWQQAHGLDASQQVYLLALTLRRRGDDAAARAAANGFLAGATDGAEPRVLAALRALAGDASIAPGEAPR